MTNRLTTGLAATALALVFCASSSDAADLVSPPAEVTANASEAKPAGPQPDAVELAALYYYASEKQADRVKAEADRLRLKYPGFDLPSDLVAPKGPQVSEAPLWALYENNDFAGIETKIASLEAKNPGWMPSADFMGKLAKRKVRITLTEAVKAKDWQAAISAGSALDLQHETEVDLLWMLADACHEAGMADQAAAVYKGILSRQGKDRLPDAVLVTTLQKASRDAEPEEVRSAMAALWPNPGQITALRPLNDDFIRRDIADFNARTERQEPLAEKDIQRLRDLVGARGEVSDMSLLGWYFMKLKQPKEAEPYFARALEAAPSIEFAKGLYLALARQGRDEEAYAVAESHLADLSGDTGFLLDALSVRLSKPDLGPVAPEAVAAYSAAILKEKSASHAEILGWYAFNSGQYKASEAWFAQAWTWEEKPERLKGLALTYMRLGKKKALKALQGEFGDLYPEMWAEISRGTAAKAGGSRTAAVIVPLGSDVSEAAPASRKTSTGGNGYVAAYQAKRYGDCLSELDRMGPVGQIPADAELMRGWCHLGLDRVADARASFQAALAGKGQVQSDAAYGVALSALRLKLTDEAEAMLASYPLPEGKAKEIRAEIAWQRARSAFDHGDYQGTLDALNARMQLTPEPTGMTTMRAWAHAKLGHRDEAKAIFQKLGQQISDPDIMKGLASLGEKQR